MEPDDGVRGAEVVGDGRGEGRLSEARASEERGGAAEERRKKGVSDEGERLEEEKGMGARQDGSAGKRSGEEGIVGEEAAVSGQWEPTAMIPPPSHPHARSTVSAAHLQAPPSSPSRSIGASDSIAEKSGEAAKESCRQEGGGLLAWVRRVGVAGMLRRAVSTFALLLLLDALIFA